MQAALTTPDNLAATPQALPSHAPATANVLTHYQIIRRNGAVVPFEPQKIAVAMMKAFLAVHGTQGAASASVREVVDMLTQNVTRALMRSRPGGGTFHIEDVQDQVELGLMRSGHHEIARAYVLYRERRTQERARQAEEQTPAAPQLHVMDGGERVALDLARLQSLIASACVGLGSDISAQPIVAETMRNLYDGVPMEEVYKASILAARTLIEKDPDYTYATARLLLHTIVREVLGREVTQAEMAQSYVDYFPQFIKKGVEHELLDERLLQYDLQRLGAALKADRDLQFDYLGLQTLYDRYFLHVKKTRIELPQAFFMRVAMGLSLNEIDREARAIECPRLSSCAWPWDSRSMRSTAKHAPSSSMRFFPASTSCPARPRCSTAARGVRSCPAATSQQYPTTSMASMSPSRKTPCCPSLLAAWATTGHACARWAATSRAPMASRKGWCPSSKWSTTRPWP